MARPKSMTVIIAEVSAIAPHFTESIGALPVYRGEAVDVTIREADAYVLFGMARVATKEEIAALDVQRAFEAELAAVTRVDEVESVEDIAERLAADRAALDAEIAREANLE